MSADTAANTTLLHQPVEFNNAFLQILLDAGTGNMTTNELRDMMNATFDFDLGIGNPSPDAFPSLEKWAQYEAFAREKYGDQLGNYGPTQGEPSFREAIAMYYADRGVEVDPTNVVVVNGAQEALAIAALLMPYMSHIITTDPTYIGFMQPNKLKAPNYVPFDPADPESLREALKRFAPVFMVYDQPFLHNPLTISQTADQRKQIEEATAESKTLLVRDQPYRELYPVDQPPPATHEEILPNQLEIGSMSKMLEPELRTGWVVIPDKRIRDLFIQIKQGLNIVTSRKAQAISEAFLRDPDRDTHLAKVRALYTDRGRKAVVAARRHLPNDWTANTEYNGSMYLAFQHPGSRVKTRRIAEIAKQLGLAVVPFEFFSPTRTAQGLRANVIYHESDVTEAGLEVLGQAIEIAEEEAEKEDE